MTSASAASAPAACGTLTPSGPLPPPTVAAISASAIASERHDERASRDAQRPVSSGLAVGGGDRDRDRVALIAVTGGDALTEAARVALARPGHHDHECQAGSMSAPRSTRRRRTARRASPSPRASADRSPCPPPARSGSPRGSGSARSPSYQDLSGVRSPAGGSGVARTASSSARACSVSVQTPRRTRKSAAIRESAGSCP